MPSPSPVVPPDDLAAVHERHLDAAHRQLARARRATIPAPMTTTSVAAASALTARSRPGTGRSASSRYWPIPVIHARPVISGTTAGRPPTSVSADEPAGEARPDDRLVDERRAERQLAAGVQLRHPRARPGAARRAVEPAGMDRRRRARVGAVAPGRVEDDVVAACDARRRRGAPGGRRRRSRSSRAAPRSIELAGPRRVDLDAGRRRVDDRVEVAAERHVVRDLADPVGLHRAVARVQERRARCAASRGGRGRPRPRRAPRPGPAGTSRRTTVSGSVTATIPVSTSTVATPIVPCPHIGRQPETSMKSTPQSASSRVGGWRIAPDIAPCPRGSRISSRRRSSISASKCALALEHRRAGHRPDAAGDRRASASPPCGSRRRRGSAPPSCARRAPCSARSAAARSSRSAPVSCEPRRAHRAADEADLVHRRP